LKAFETIRDQAQSQWASLYHGQTPHILIGTASCGRAAGSMAVVEAFKNELARQNAVATVSQVGCMGLCSLEPLVIIIKPGSFTVCYHHVTAQLVPVLVDGYVLGDDPCLDLALGTVEGGDDKAISIPELPRFEHERRLILRHCGYIRPENIEDYIANGGYSSLARALQMNPVDIIEAIKRSGLRGGGAQGSPPGQSGNCAAIRKVMTDM
jgi:NADH-quinone oxidoreductase subunit F